MATGRRFLGTVPRLTRRAWENAAQELEDFLRRLWASESDGIPAGFNDVSPSTVEAQVGTQLGDPGTEGLGWAAADHDHSASTATPIALDPDSVSAEGTEPTLARSDHSHDVSALSDDAFIWSIVFGGK